MDDDRLPGMKLLRYFNFVSRGFTPLDDNVRKFICDSFIKMFEDGEWILGRRRVDSTGLDWSRLDWLDWAGWPVNRRRALVLILASSSTPFPTLPQHRRGVP